MYQEYISYQVTPRKYEILYLNAFWLGLLFYTLGSIFGAIEGSLDIRLCQAIEAIGLIAMVPTCILLVKAKFDSGYLRAMFILYFIWLMTIIFRGNFSFNYTFIKEFLFGSNNGGLIYFAPLIVLFPRNFTYYKKLFSIISIGAILFPVLCIVFLKKLLVHGQDFQSQAVIESLFDISIPPAFIILTYLYHSKKTNLIAIGSVAVTLIFSVIRARRGLLFITSSLTIYCFFIYFSNSKKKLLIIYCSILLLSITALYKSNMYNTKKNPFIGFLSERGDEDSRTPVELCFYGDMKTEDWIVGKGITGQYFCPNIEELQVTDYRTAIETGYLQLILKGGIISLGLLLLITIPAIIKGLFFSKNILSKAAALWIFQCIIDLYPQNSVGFSPSYLMVWISVGICYSKEIRNLSNEAIKNILYNS